MRYFVRQRMAAEPLDERVSSVVRRASPARPRRGRALSPEARAFLALCVGLGYVDTDGVCILGEADFERLRDRCRERLPEPALVEAVVARLRSSRPSAGELCKLLDGDGPLSARAVLGLAVRLRDLRAQSWLGRHVRELIAACAGQTEVDYRRLGDGVPAETRRARDAALLRGLGLGGKLGAS